MLFIQYGQTPLWIASFYGHQKCMELLIDAGADVNEKDEVSVVHAHISVAETTSPVTHVCIIEHW